MENASSILVLLVSALAVTYLGYRINKERGRLRKVVAILGDEDAGLIQSLESMVHGGPPASVAT